ncbi:MAG: tRNA threonylcarbamoyladenosine dehydratase [Methylotenera sp.]|nr:MAG: tRNA threonylcarbamoyladenosine dehydratase [Methylotenera sp.]
MNPVLDTVDIARRFGGVSRLYGQDGLQCLQSSHVCVIGIGGVGSWTVEALARNAIGCITLVDLDNIAESNVNRQLHALEGAFGKAKVTAMAERIRLINPHAEVIEVEDFITADNVIQILDQDFDGIIDCIDDAKAKVAIAAFSRQKQIPLIMTGGAGGRLDPTHIQFGDLSLVTGDRLLAKVRNALRRDHGFPKGYDGNGKISAAKRKAASFNIPTVFSDEPVIQPVGSPDQEADASCEVNAGVTGLNCAGYGSSVCVTAPFGFAAASLLIKTLLSRT